MTLNEWFNQKGNTQEKLAELMSRHGKKITQGGISQWRDTSGIFVVPPTRIMQVATALDWKVTPIEMNSVLYQDVPQTEPQGAAA